MPGIVLEATDGVAVLTLDNPPVNALDRDMTAELGRCLDAVVADAAIRALVLRGGGTRAFSAGSDVREFPALLATPGRMAAKFAEDAAVFECLAHLPKPTIAAVEGIAYGGGLELAVCCDLIVAGEGARFALPEIRLGAFPGSGGTVRVTRRIGPARVREMMLLGDPVDAPTALAWHLVNRVVADGTAAEAALTLARRLAGAPARAVQRCRQALDAALDHGEAEALALARRFSEELAETRDLQEGVRAFLERRTPVFADGIDPDFGAGAQGKVAERNSAE